MIDGTLTQDATQGTSKLEANGETARSDFDYFTVLQDIAGGDISAKFYLTDNVFSGDEEAIASNPLIGLTDDELLGAVVGQGELSLMKFMFNEDTAFDALFDAELAVVTLSDTDIDDRNQSSEAARNVRSVQNSPEADIYVQADTLDSSLFVTLNSELEIAVEALQDGPVVPQFYSTLSSLPAIRFSQDGGQSVAQAELEAQAQAEAEAAAQAELEAQAQAEAEAAAQAELEAQAQAEAEAAAQAELEAQAQAEAEAAAQAELEAQAQAEAEAAAQAELEAQAQAEAEAAAQAELEAQVQIRVSHKTEGGDTINSTDGYDLSADNYGELYTVKGNEMDIAGVSNNAKISYVYHDANTVEVTLDTPWNSVKNIEISSENSANITLNNFVHTDVSLGGEGGSTVIINGAKRGNITTGGSDDVVEVNAQTNGPGWGNDFTVNTGEGADTITAIGDKGHTGFNIDAGDDNDNVTVGGSYDGSNIQLGQGSDVFTGGDGNDTVNGGDDADVLQGGNGDDILNGGAGNDVIQGGGGNDILEGGTGNDTFIIQAGDGNTTIKDFGGVGGGGSGEADLMPHHDTIKLQGAGLDAENMLLEYDGKNTIVTFEGVEGFSITLDNFDFTDLDNLPNVQGWNFIFDGQDTGSDAYDVFNNHGTGQAGVWNKDIVTHLNDADNKVSGRDDSDDVINAMNGDDVVSGGTGDDVLRGQAGDDVLYGDDAEDTGSSQVTTTIDVTYVSTTAGYRNAIGAYTVDSNGKILGVSIGIEDQHAADAGEHFTIEVSGPEAAGVGYFILSDGYNKNAAFFDRYDSDDGEYSFLYKAGTEEEVVSQNITKFENTL